MHSLITAALAALEQVRRSPLTQTRQLTTAFVGLVVMIALPAVLVYWARKRFRP
jgi:hypothetical protein